MEPAILLVVIVVIIVAVIVVISTKINNTVFRGKQQVLGSVGLGSADMMGAMGGEAEKKHIAAFLAEHPDMDEQQLKSKIRDIAEKAIHQNFDENFSDMAKKQIAKDKLREKIISADFARISVLYYKDSELRVYTVYADRRDEYEVFLVIKEINGKFMLDRYSSSIGAVKGLK